MNDDPSILPEALRSRRTSRPGADRIVHRTERAVLLLALFLAVVRFGLLRMGALLEWELGVPVVAALVVQVVGFGCRAWWSLNRAQFLRANAARAGLLFTWVAGCVAVPGLAEEGSLLGSSPWFAVFRWSSVLVCLLGVVYAVGATRRAAGAAASPSLLLVLSFAVLVAVGTILLTLPRARAHPPDDASREGAPLLTALFTATSASCVTGLVVEPTGAYWSPFGHAVILVLFQIGGLGIMTCGAFFVAVTGTRLSARESATLANMLDTEGPDAVRRLLRAILLATFGIELAGAVLMWGLWEGHPFWERCFYSFFHSASSFCNAGFDLRGTSFLGWGTRWEVWGVSAGLIVAGGLGFSVVYNLFVYARLVLSGRSVQRSPLFRLPGERPRLTLASKLVLFTTGGLLLGGTFGYYVLETIGGASGSVTTRLADAWFQSVTFRTAGFNTVDHAGQHPATKLFGILLMFVGASPGSTGGGIKTLCFALAVLAIVSYFRGHDRLDVMGRTVPAGNVNRALTVLALGLMVLMTETLLLTLFESDNYPFLDLLYEATSAFATVGVSTGITGDLTPPSQIVIVVAMFVGRVGPLTLLMGLARRRGEIRYSYPNETVTLG